MHNMKESSENYLEAIYVLHKEQGHVRSIDVANHLELSRPSVSKAVKKLEEEGHLVMQDDGELRLTESGRNIGKGIASRHVILRDFLIKIGVNDKTADLDACKIEHALSEESFDKLKEFLTEE